MPVLPDGAYDVIVVEAESDDAGGVRLELTITLGPHLGRIVALRGHQLDSRRGLVGEGDPISLLGIPGTLRVSDGVPSFRPERV